MQRIVDLFHKEPTAASHPLGQRPDRRRTPARRPASAASYPYEADDLRAGGTGGLLAAGVVPQMACEHAPTSARRDRGAMTMAVAAAGLYAGLLKGQGASGEISNKTGITKASLHRYLRGLSGSANDAR
ncbi:hypothetical protein [Streptomyces sp. MUM 16J]|uniref:hypothetical protein n=1 Tax=Streptomyces sp. MUM 16J TaxID=2791988 RepID=UPI001F04219C|nr:hypothetical protein [Streptomyces sp. MUM 16J]MCH0558902.1 hypothetical protein [Streptomyces sp. MUM 16J]